jgi:hypothetical protein
VSSRPPKSGLLSYALAQLEDELSSRGVKCYGQLIGPRPTGTVASTVPRVEISICCFVRIRIEIRLDGFG